MLDLILGSACLFLPPQVQAGVVAGSFVLGTLRRHRRRKASNTRDNDTSVHPEQCVTLSWSHVTCRLSNKDGSDRVLLDKLQGEAKPGRVMAIFGPSGSGLYSIEVLCVDTCLIVDVFSQVRRHC